MNKLYYGDNLDILRNKIGSDTVDLCYIDPPFNSKRNYFQIYNNIGGEDRAQAQAFVDTWEWEEEANLRYDEITRNPEGRFSVQSVELIKGLQNVLGKGSLLAYLVSMTLRITEIQRVLKPTGSFYLHCDPTCSHYLKLVLDAAFCARGGDFKNEIAWCYASGGVSKRYFGKKHDIIFFYTKSDTYLYNTQYRPYTDGTLQRGLTKYKKDLNPDYKLRSEGAVMNDWWSDVTPLLSPTSKERLGYPTQKPEALLERIIQASSNEGDLVLDAYCGCGTTIAVAERLKRRWIGIDITYQSIGLVLKRLEDTFGKAFIYSIKLDGIPQDMDSAIALAHKQDDRLRKEFEKWAVLTYSDNRAVVGVKKGADKGIDGTAYFAESRDSTGKVIFQVKSGLVNRQIIAALHGDMERENAQIAILITLAEPTQPMLDEASAAGAYHHALMGRNYNRIQVVTIAEMLAGKRLELPLSLEVVKSAEPSTSVSQLEIGLDGSTV